MVRRWLIRSLFMLPLLLCVCGWAWSLTHFGRVFCRIHGHQMQLGTVGGEVMVLDIQSEPPWHDGWGGVAESQSYLGFWPAFNPGHPIVPGLGWNHYTQPKPASLDVYEIYIPYWLLIPPFLTLLFAIWRMPRRRIVIHAFPMEPTKTTEQHPAAQSPP